VNKERLVFEVTDGVPTPEESRELVSRVSIVKNFSFIRF